MYKIYIQVQNNGPERRPGQRYKRCIYFNTASLKKNSKVKFLSADTPFHIPGCDILDHKTYFWLLS